MPYTDLIRQTLKPKEGFYTSELHTSEEHANALPSPRPLPVRTFLPTGYEPRYAYPLLVFFHGQGGNEEQILRLAPRLSRRNYISIGLRGPIALGSHVGGSRSFSWGDSAVGSMVEDYLIRAVEQTRLNYHVHSERIY